MRSSFSTIMALAASVPAVLAHYNFEALIVNGNTTDPYEYVRQTTNSNSPIDDVTSANMVCNAGGTDADIMAKTSTHSVAPGDEVGFTINSEIGHPGPLAVYMSKAPTGTDANAYEGDGDWFKVYSLTTSDITDAGLQWATYVNNAGIHNFTFALPEDLAPGDYLMRAEHIGLHAAGSAGGAQFYIGCAQLTVTGSGSGTPTDVVSFPGAYDGTEPGILIGIYYPVPTSYTAPGPAVWPNSCEDHTANFAGQSSDGDCTGSTESDSGSDSGSGSGSSATDDATAVATATATVIPVAASSTAAAASNTPAATTPAAEVPVTTSIVATPVQDAATSAAEAETPAATATSSPDTCAAKRSARKARRAAKRAAKRSLREKRGF
ncbi:glycosyl hydrolase family 61-domain-containing protein [Dactylonectria estremocensis]|uniref:lytic cellulose monooxygenase (C4-dehydrogenating) n=1 Tax=Dactylonectria estremocensis TaxID=1079267 RepID=A0A9P9IUS4_9HYPO|nr:glycosyl hydrolase family 61-domain-containing protein [Dactylonectria estremocensis]